MAEGPFERPDVSGRDAQALENNEHVWALRRQLEGAPRLLGGALWIAQLLGSHSRASQRQIGSFGIVGDLVGKGGIEGRKIAPPRCSLGEGHQPTNRFR